MTRTNTIDQLLLRITEASLTGDTQRLHSAVTTAVKSLRKDHPELSRSLASLLSSHAINPNSLRWSKIGPPPADTDEGMALVRAFETDDAEAPILVASVEDEVKQFVRERVESDHLFHEGLLPAHSILMTGAPGTGKTMLARWIARELRLPFLVQDLATSISSLLGRTGLNLRRTLDYARSRPCVLLLDEFDAIAKRRDDNSELGELKRIVNVLLKELEEWPTHSVLIAATNHPALLDPAIARRFHLVLRVPLPGKTERHAIISRALGRFRDEVPCEFINAFASTLDGSSGSDIETLIHRSVRRHLITKTHLAVCLVESFWSDSDDKTPMRGNAFGELLREFKKASGEDRYTVRDLAALFKKSTSTIQHHLKRG